MKKIIATLMAVSMATTPVMAAPKKVDTVLIASILASVTLVALLVISSSSEDTPASP